MPRVTAIHTEHLTRRFGPALAVDGLTCEVHAGEVFGLLGHNGAGKTTTVRLLNGVLEPTAGRLEVLGLDPVRQGPALRRRTGVLTETPSLDERLTGRENLEIYAELFDVPRGEVARRVAEVLATFDLAERAHERAAGYSKGMKQRLALARALLHSPELLFLDEPTAGLDPVATRQVHELITRLSRQEHHTVVLCTHNLGEAQQLCDRVAVMAQGRLLALGTPRELGHRFGPVQRLEIEVSPDTLLKAVYLLNAWPGVTGIVQQRATLSVTGIERDGVPGVIAALVGAGVQVYGVAPREATLEEVYFALQGEPAEQGPRRAPGDEDGTRQQARRQRDGR